MSVGRENRFQLTAELPLMFTVEEAAAVLRIGRTLAYSLARRYEETDGTDGLPVIRLGTCLRVPRRALLELAGTGCVAPPPASVAPTGSAGGRPDGEQPVDVQRLVEVAERIAPKSKSSGRSARPVAVVVRSGQQLALLPFE